MMGSRTEGWKGNEIEVDQAPRPRAAEVSVPEALVRCSPPMTGLKMAPTSGTLLCECKCGHQRNCGIDEQKSRREMQWHRKPAQAHSLDAEPDRDAAGRQKVHEIDGLYALNYESVSCWSSPGARKGFGREKENEGVRRLGGR